MKFSEHKGENFNSTDDAYGMELNIVNTEFDGPPSMYICDTDKPLICLNQATAKMMIVALEEWIEAYE